MEIPDRGSSPPPAPLHLVVLEEDAGTRLDLYLCGKVTVASRNFIQGLIRRGDVTVNEEPAKSGRRLAAGDQVRVILPNLEEIALEPLDIPLDILHEDDAILVLSKPRGLVIHPSAGHWRDTLVNALIHHYGDRLSTISGSHRPGIVHRLDKGTSGVLVIARTDASHQALQRQFMDRLVEKRYWALVWGEMTPETGVIEGAIGRDPHHPIRYAVLPEGGKEAVTHYEVAERLDGFSLILARPLTGRTHQIRVHLKSRGYPIVGDLLYGGRQYKRLGEPRRSTLRAFEGFALHAGGLVLTHPTTGERLTFTVPIPDDMQALIDAFRQ